MKKSFSQFRTILPTIQQNGIVLDEEKFKTPENIIAPEDPTIQRFMMPSELDRPCYLMCPPFSLDTSSPNNVIMKELQPKNRKINLIKAIDQFFAIYSFVTNMALVYLLPSKEGLQDLPYVANLGINLPHTPDNTIILANYKSEPRQDETPLGKEFFENLGYETIIAPQYFEGEADLKYLNKNNYCGAYGMRTNMDALHWFSKSFDMNIIPVKMTDKNMYHLDCVMFPLEPTKLFVVTKAIDKNTLTKIEKVTNIIDIPDIKFGQLGITNCVRINTLILHGTRIDDLQKGTDDYDEELRKNNFLEHLCVKNGYDVVFFNISEFSKSGAALSCMLMHLNYPEFKMRVNL